MRKTLTILLLTTSFSAFSYDSITGPTDTPPNYKWPTETKVLSARNFLPTKDISYAIQVSGDKGIGIYHIPPPEKKNIGGYLDVYNLTGSKIVSGYRITSTASFAPITGEYRSWDPAWPTWVYYYFASKAQTNFTYTPPRPSSREYIFAKYSGESYFSLPSESDTTVITRNPEFPALVAIKKNGSSGKTETHVMSGPNKYTTFLHQIATALNKTGYDNEWTFDGADYNNDGVRDLIAIDKQGSSGKVDIHVLDGATNYQTFLLHKATAQAAVDADLSWNFGMGDFNKDGHLDLYCIRKNGTTGYTEVHILDGSNSFASYLLHKATPLGSTGSDDSWSFRVADYDGDGVDDVYAIKKNQGTQIHVLDGATSFTTYSLRTNTPFGSMGSDQAWVADIADYNADGYPDAYFVLRESSGNKTAVHILDGKSQYQDFLLRTNTALAGTGVDGSWSFVVSQ